MKTVLGHILHVMRKDAEAWVNVREEKSSTLVIRQEFVKGAGPDRRDVKRVGNRKSWSISSVMLFDAEEFERLFEIVRDGVIVDIAWGANSGGYRYWGEAFPVKVKVEGSVGELLKVQVQWQGTGALDYDILR